MPRKPDTHQLCAYCTDEEYRMIVAAAKADRRNLSNYILTNKDKRRANLAKARASRWPAKTSAKGNAQQGTEAATKG